ncbi:MAG: DNA-binding transcriptional regulator [Lentisphaerae bacterium]|nr:DNA-binding transcriptional regulator [Lentisphaerota bacterium]
MAKARMVRRFRPHVIVLSEPTHPTGREFLQGIFQYAEEQGGWSLHYATRALRERPGEWLSLCDGVIARMPDDRTVRAIRRRGVAYVSLDYGRRPRRDRPQVGVADHAIGRKAAAFFVRQGARAFAYVGRTGKPWSERRLAGFRQEVRRRGGTVRVMDIMPFEAADAPMPWNLHERLGAWAKALPRPCAVLCANDEIGFHVAEACGLAGLRIPDELSLLGIDNDTLFCELCHPPLASIDPGHRRCGWRAAACLDRLMRGRLPQQAVELVPPGEIVVRRSADRLAITDPNLAAAVRYIEDHACEALNVSAVTAHAGLSRSVLQRRFKAAFGQTVHERIVQTRLEHACRLLVRTARPIGDIAEQAGFAHQSYMGAVFRRRLGLSPAQYRRTTPRDPRPEAP